MEESKNNLENTKKKLKQVNWRKYSRLILEIVGVVILLICGGLYVDVQEDYENLSEVHDTLQSQYSTLLDDYNDLNSRYSEYKNRMIPYEEMAEADEQAKKAQDEAEAQALREQAEAQKEQELLERQQQEDLEKSKIYEGTYKVGTDIPAGEYVLFSTMGGYFSVSSDSTGSFSSIIFNDNFDYNTIVTVSDGQYLDIKRSYAVPIGQQGYTLKTTGEGMFKVGLHIPAGEYKIVADGDGYVEVSSDSTHDLNSIVTNDNFTGEKYITVSDGQYLKLSRAHIQQ